MLTKRIISLLLALSLLFLISSCSSGREEKKSSVIRIATSGITGNFNPFYASSRGDVDVLGQIYPSIQRKGPDNKLINDLGTISYEYENDDSVKYTVTIKDDLHFSDGSSVSIDDVIFWYYLLADASYDGVYSSFYLSDIEGLKEYYYDDPDYASNISGLTPSAIKTYISKNYANGIDVETISGIKRVDDYTCTVLFRSRNINAVSAINAVIVSKAFFGADYVKGGAEKVKSVTKSTMGCGAYYLSDYDESSGKTTLLANSYAAEPPKVFTKAEFIDLAGEGITPLQAIKDGRADIVSAVATPSVVSTLSTDSFKWFFTNEKSYTSLFINTSVPVEARKILMGLFSAYDAIEKEYSGCYTRLTRPLSVRFEEYPAGANTYYRTTLMGALLQSYVTSLNAYCIGSQDDLPYKILSEFASHTAQYNVKINIKACGESDFYSAVRQGKADLWIDSIPDGDTCDKYDYFNSRGSLNYTGLNDAQTDELTVSVRRATGFADRGALMKELLDRVMENAVEMPIYQNQIVTIYSTSLIDPQSLSSAGECDGYKDILKDLY